MDKPVIYSNSTTHSALVGKLGISSRIENFTAEEFAAKIRLIDAAEDLLKACKNILICDSKFSREDAEYAIAKAEGKNLE
jgi:hypothetical protein